MQLHDLRPNEGQIPGVPANPRTITEEDFAKLKKSLRNFTKMLILRPIIVDEQNNILGGNMRYQALRMLAKEGATCEGVTFGEEIPEEWVKQATDLTPEEKMEFILKDNQERGQWDYDRLANEWDAALLKEWDVPAAEWDTEATESATPSTSGEEAKEHQGNLAKNYIVPPFSILDTKAGYWQERKAAWLQKTGNLSETRDGEYGRVSNAGETLYSGINGGTSNFDPVLAEIAMTWFCKPGGRVLDPFGGEQTKGVVAGELGMFYRACEFRSDQVALNEEKTKQYPGVRYVCGDSNKIDELIEDRGFDLCFTSPPYYDLEVYSKDDMSALGTYEEFMQQYENIFRRCYSMLADNAFLVVKVCEIRDKKTGIYRNFVGDNITCMNRIGFHYYNEIILANAIGTAALRANNNMRSRKVVKVHQNVLVFYKGDIEALTAGMPALNFEEESEEAESQEDSQEEGARIESQQGGEFFREMQPLYTAFSRKSLPTRFDRIPQGLAPLVAAATEGRAMVAEEEHKRYARLEREPNAAEVVLAYTGGKDSIAQAIRLQREGYEVTLAFIKGLNKAYPGEQAGAEACAKIMGLPMVVLEAKVSGKNAHPDNPVKNQAILALMADWARANGVGSVSTGIVPVEDANYEYDWSDKRTLMEAYVAHMERSAAVCYVPVRGSVEGDNLWELLEHARGEELYEHRTSCVGTHRFKKTWRQQNMEKYGVHLPEGDCGSCYKCCFSYIVKSVHSGTTNTAYLRKCFEVVKEKGGIYHTSDTSNMREFIRQHFGDNLTAQVYALYQQATKR